MRSSRSSCSLSSSSRSSYVRGDVFNNLAAAGKMAYQKLCDSNSLSLERILYCEEALKCLRISSKSSFGKKKVEDPPTQGVVNHDYLVLELDDEGKKLYILAEKVGGQPGEAGISIRWCNDEDLERELCTLALQLNVERVDLENVVKVLENFDPKYHWLWSNCWKYAKETAQNLVTACLKSVADDDSAKARRLQEELIKISKHY